MAAPQYGAQPPPPQPPQGYGGYGGGGAALPDADVTKRLIGGLIDGAIMFGIWVAMYILIIVLAVLKVGFLGTIVWLIGLALVFMYRPFFEVTKGGQSIGSKMQGIKTVKTDGSDVDWGAALLRQIPFYFIAVIEAIVMYVTPEHKRLGDMIGNTRKVDVSGAVAPAAAPAGYGAPPPQAMPPQPMPPQAPPPAAPPPPAMPPQAPPPAAPPPPAMPPQAPPPAAPPPPAMPPQAPPPAAPPPAAPPPPPPPG